MKSYGFTVFLDLEEMSEDDAERLYVAGCDDGLCCSSCGRAYVGFDREARSLEDALRSALADVRKAGFRVTRVELEPEDLAVLENAQDAAPQTRT
ncbi:MAG: hypothetical protein KY475_11040 [Planctomycetes bacterium]|nr:hypothetical protein [Planctomycetota bacterium]